MLVVSGCGDAGGGVAGALLGVAALAILVGCWDLLSRALGREVTPGFMGDVLTPQILIGAAVTIGGVAVVALAERGLRAGASRS